MFDDALVDDQTEADTVITHVVTVGGERLDKWLAGQLPEHSRAEIQRWIDDDLVTAQNRPLKASYRVTVGDEVTVVVPPVEDYAVEPEAIPLEIVFEDADLLVIDKPAGMVVHPAAGNWHGTLVNAVLYHCPDLEGVGGVAPARHRPSAGQGYLRSDPGGEERRRRIVRSRRSSRRARSTRHIWR